MILSGDWDSLIVNSMKSASETEIRVVMGMLMAVLSAKWNEAVRKIAFFLSSRSFQWQFSSWVFSLIAQRELVLYLRDCTSQSSMSLGRKMLLELKVTKMLFVDFNSAGR
jgi:hypothetical protein